MTFDNLYAYLTAVCPNEKAEIEGNASTHNNLTVIAESFVGPTQFMPISR